MDNFWGKAATSSYFQDQLHVHKCCLCHEDHLKFGFGCPTSLIPQPKCQICMQNDWEKQQCQTDDSRLKYSSKYFMNYFLFWSNHKEKLQEQYREFFSWTIWEQVADLVPHHFWIF